MKAVVVAIVAGLAIMMMEPMQATIDCEKLKLALSPCLQYLTGITTDPSPACCNGMETLKSSTPTQDDRRAACQCLKDAAAQFPIREDRAKALPQSCGIEVGVPISKDIKCSDFEPCKIVTSRKDMDCYLAINANQDIILIIYKGQTCINHKGSLLLTQYEIMFKSHLNQSSAIEVDCCTFKINIYEE
ncbi:non-specific lipid-transfer protein A [Senna tora]|uniref:Non-specific lipid-transfer protein n=1 Tax=Senna tora TaxID=362788 RepID=A0A834WVU5_9FABA|nr:non-specific lipid-transfer protein A [Senna tora]